MGRVNDSEELHHRWQFFLRYYIEHRLKILSTSLPSFIFQHFRNSESAFQRNRENTEISKSLATYKVTSEAYLGPSSYLFWCPKLYDSWQQYLLDLTTQTFIKSSLAHSINYMSAVGLKN